MGISGQRAAHERVQRENGALDGIWTEWNSAGEISGTRTYKDGQLVVDPEQAN